MAVRQAALEAAGARLRAIVMTSLAFGLACVPLRLPAGRERTARAIGTGMVGGILASTMVAVFFAPLFFWILESLSARFGGKKAAAAPGGAVPVAAAHARKEND